jgi:hypothetical protein
MQSADILEFSSLKCKPGALWAKARSVVLCFAELRECLKKNIDTTFEDSVQTILVYTKNTFLTAQLSDDGMPLEREKSLPLLECSIATK